MFLVGRMHEEVVEVFIKISKFQLDKVINKLNKYLEHKKNRIFSKKERKRKKTIENHIIQKTYDRNLR